MKDDKPVTPDLALSDLARACPDALLWMLQPNELDSLDRAQGLIGLAQFVPPFIPPIGGKTGRVQSSEGGKSQYR